VPSPINLSEKKNGGREGGEQRYNKMERDKQRGELRIYGGALLIAQHIKIINLSLLAFASVQRLFLEKF